MRKVVREILLSGVLAATGSTEKIVEAGSAVEHTPGINIAALVASKKNEQNPMLPVGEKSNKNIEIGKASIRVPGILPSSLTEARGKVTSLLKNQDQANTANLQNELEVPSIPVSPQPSPWEIHGFAEQQFRPGQDFQSTAVWTQAGKKGSKLGVFNFSQFASRLTTKRNSWGQSYAGPYIASDTKRGYLEGGVAAGVEVGPHPRFAGYGVFAPKAVPGFTVLGIVERGKDFWNRLELKKTIGAKWKAGYHHQTGLGNGINVQWDPKKNWQVFSAVTYDNKDGKVKAMTAVRRKF